jgi:hypothetical protein
MNEHRIVLVIDATYRTDDPDQTIAALMDQHHAITSKRAQARPVHQTYALIGESADHLIDLLEENHAPE